MTSIQTEKHEKYIIIRATAEKLDAQNAPDLKSEIVFQNKNGARNIIVNLEKSRYCDSSALSALLIGKRLCNEVQGSFVLCHLQDAVAKLIQISKLDAVLTIVPTEEEATDYVMMEEIEREIGAND